MRTLIHRIGIVLTLAAASTSLHSSQSSDSIDDLFRRAHAAQAAMKTLKASFTETTVSSMLVAPVTATGTLVATLPLRVVMEYKTPVIKTIALDDQRMVVAWADRAKAEEMDISAIQRRVAKYFVDASPKELRDSFTIVLGTDHGSAGNYRLELTPKRKQIAEGMTRLEIGIDRATFMMTKMTMTYASGDSKSLELRGLTVNPTLDEAAFALLRRGGR